MNIPIWEILKSLFYRAQFVCGWWPFNKRHEIQTHTYSTKEKHDCSCVEFYAIKNKYTTNFFFIMNENAREKGKTLNYSSLIEMNGESLPIQLIWN